jgi:hypothetical protein
MKNGEIWLDDSGAPIQAHGGCIIKHEEKWYWYGENKGVDNVPNRNQVPFIGIACYMSSNLRDWHFAGNVLEADQHDPASPLHTSKICERPKVIYNAAPCGNSSTIPVPGRSTVKHSGDKVPVFFL